jgi:shikimate kinase
MGSGKTTVGAELAARLGRPFVDSDVEIERATGRDGRAIAATDGTPALQAFEARMLLAALAAPGPDVIAAAASVVDDAACRRALRGPDVAVIRLRARPATLAKRHATGAHRRPLGPDLAAGFAAQVRVRAPRFAAVRPLVTIDVDRAATEVVVDTALAALAPGAGAGPPAATAAAAAGGDPHRG